MNVQNAPPGKIKPYQRAERGPPNRNGPPGGRNRAFKPVVRDEGGLPGKNQNETVGEVDEAPPPSRMSYHRPDSCGADGRYENPPILLKDSMRKNGIRCEWDDLPLNPEERLRHLESARNKACTCARERALEMQRKQRTDQNHIVALRIAEELCKQCNGLYKDEGGTSLSMDELTRRVVEPTAVGETLRIPETTAAATAARPKTPPTINTAAWMWLRQYIEGQLVGIPLALYPSVDQMTERVRSFVLHIPPTSPSLSRVWLDVPMETLRTNVSDLMTFFHARKNLEVTKKQILAAKRRRIHTLSKKAKAIQSLQRLAIPAS